MSSPHAPREGLPYAEREDYHFFRRFEGGAQGVVSGGRGSRRAILCAARREPRPPWGAGSAPPEPLALLVLHGEPDLVGVHRPERRALQFVEQGQPVGVVPLPAAGLHPGTGLPELPPTPQVVRSAGRRGGGPLLTV